MKISRINDCGVLNAVRKSGAILIEKECRQCDATMYTMDKRKKYCVRCAKQRQMDSIRAYQSTSHGKASMIAAQKRHQDKMRAKRLLQA